MNKFNVGDKVTVKENFWEIGSDVSWGHNKKKLAGRTLEVEFVYDDGDVFTKQDDSNNDTGWSWDKNWVELYTELRTEITWDNLKWKDVLVYNDGIEQMVLDVRNDLVDVSGYGNFDTHGYIRHKQELKNTGYTIKQDIPLAEKLELTLDQIAEKYGVDVTNIKIKK